MGLTMTEPPTTNGFDTGRREWLDDHRDEIRAKGTEQRWPRAMLRGTAHPHDWHTRHWSSRLLHRVGELAATAVAGVVAAVGVAAWTIVGVFSGFPRWWEVVLYSVTASVTFVMVFVIQHTQSRQTTAMQRKLDELIRATTHTDNDLIAVEEATDEELQALVDLNFRDRHEQQRPDGAAAPSP